MACDGLIRFVSFPLLIRGYLSHIHIILQWVKEELGPWDQRAKQAKQADGASGGPSCLADWPKEAGEFLLVASCS